MEIVKQPTKHITKDPIYETECTIDYTGFEKKGCGAVLRFRESEITKISDQRDGDAEYIVCPCCGKTIWNSHFNKFRLVEE